LAERDERGWLSLQLQLPSDSGVHNAGNRARVDQKVETVQVPYGPFVTTRCC
jgi:hypothetical protein